MKICTYIVTHDSGFAPNPFGEWCSLSTCTPNHQGAQLKEGDWICGFSTKSEGHKLIYAMRVDERLHMSLYFTDVRFSYKKPGRSTSESRCGDNFYEQLSDGSWQQHWSFYHNVAYKKKDTRRPYVFVGKIFWYFGENRIEIPRGIGLKIGGKGIRTSHMQGAEISFIQWLQDMYPPGIYGSPTHNSALNLQKSYISN